MSRVTSCRLRQGLHVCRIINGMWQVSGSHGTIDADGAVDEMFKYFDAGLTTFDMADIYGPAEIIFGKFRSKLKHERGAQAADQVQALTKWVPQPGVMAKHLVQTSIEKSLRRMGVDKIDMLQFHWWDFSDKRYLDALVHLSELQSKGVIQELSLTNFNTDQLKEVIKLGIDISTNQIQYSIIDNRATVKMKAFCKKHDIGLLTYGTLAGGFLSERYLHVVEPTLEELQTASLRKYKQVIDAWGGWDLFQLLLAKLDQVAKANLETTIANIVTRFMLDKQEVSAVIIGARFGVAGAEHVSENLRSFDLNLDYKEFDSVKKVLSDGNDLFKSTGDCGDEYQ